LPKNDEGEFELVLGNRQLISVFLIVVVLLGVFFSMGYIVGRNSSPALLDSARNDKPKPDADSSDGANPDSASATPDAPPQSTPPEVTKPAKSAPPAAAPAKPEPARTKEIRPKPSPSPAPVHAAAAGEPSTGQYWQVVATARPDAEIIAEALGKKGFRVVLAPIPGKEGIFRVLVGPLADASSQAQTRTGLETAGFKNPIMRKY